MVHKMTLEEVEQLAAQLAPQEQLKLVAHVCETLSTTVLTSLPTDKEKLRRQGEKEADEILALCDAAAEQWQGKLNAATEIRRMRQERIKRLCQNKS